MVETARPLAVITGASSGIGYELAKCCAEHGFDLMVAADEEQIRNAARDFQMLGAKVEPVVADLAELDGGRPVDALLANASRGLGKGFLNQNFDDVRHVIAPQKQTFLNAPTCSIQGRPGQEGRPSRRGQDRLQIHDERRRRRGQRLAQ